MGSYLKTGDGKSQFIPNIQHKTIQHLQSEYNPNTNFENDACIYAFGKSTNLTSKHRWKRLLKSATLANVNIIKKNADITDQSQFNITCCSSKPYLGLWKSNLNIWKHAKSTCTKTWTLLLENDAEIPVHFNQLFKKYTQNMDVLFMDSRNGYHSGPHKCCTVGMAYKTSILQKFIFHFSPEEKNAMWHDWTKEGKTCLFDWYLYDIVKNTTDKSYTAGFVLHPSNNKEKDV